LHTADAFLRCRAGDWLNSLLMFDRTARPIDRPNCPTVNVILVGRETIQNVWMNLLADVD
jgi:hypothetical protein